MPKISETTYRVYYMPSTLVTAWRKTRDKQHTTNLSFITTATDTHLAHLVKELRAVGMCGRAEARQAVRAEVPVTVLRELGAASEATGVPATQLLAICLSRASRPTGRKSRRGA
jgi:hypothetical protein